MRLLGERFNSITDLCMNIEAAIGPQLDRSRHSLCKLPMTSLKPLERKIISQLSERRTWQRQNRG
jgi:hypothetical protein